MFMGVADDLRDTGESGDLVRRTLRITSCNDDLCLRVFAMGPADGGPGVLVRHGGNGTSIQDDNVRIPTGGGALQTAFFELSLDCGAICLSGATPKILYVISRHHTIVAALFRVARAVAPFEHEIVAGTENELGVRLFKVRLSERQVYW